MPHEDEQEREKKAVRPKKLPVIDEANVMITKHPQRAVAVLRQWLQQDK